MKKKFLVLLLILVTFTIAFSTINAHAEEIDYNSVVAFEVGEEMVTYSTLGINGASWRTLLDVYIDQGLNHNFHSDGDYLMYDGKMVLHGRTGIVIKMDDAIVPAAGCVYKLYDPAEAITIEEGKINFDSKVLGMEFQQFIKMLRKKDQFSLLTFGGTIGRFNVFYRGCALTHPDGTVVHTDEVIANDFDYYISSNECNHRYEFRYYIKEPTCSETGSGVEQCLGCGLYREVFYPIDNVSGHNYVYYDSTPATCVSTGYLKNKCTICQNIEYTLISMTSHDFIEKSCTQPKECKNCGFVTESNLGHDYTSNTCTEAAICRRCGDVVAEAYGHKLKNINCTQSVCVYCGQTIEESYGHKLNSIGKCVYKGCKYWDVSKILPAVGKGANDVLEAGGKVVGNVISLGIDGVKSIVRGIGEAVSGEPSPEKEKAKGVFWLVLMLIPIIFLIYIIVILSIKVKNKLKNNHRKKK